MALITSWLGQSDKIHVIAAWFPPISLFKYLYTKLASACNVVLRTIRDAFRTSTREFNSLPPYPLAYEQQDANKQEFISSINWDAICNLASSHNHQKPCRIFNTTNGSFNACFCVEFSDGERWVVRVPIEPAIYDVWVKLQSEVATMRCVSRDSHVVPRLTMIQVPP